MDSSTSPIPSLNYQAISNKRNEDDESELPSSSQTSCDVLEGIRLRRRLKFFFLNPIEKWNTKRRFPFKFTIQVVKIILVTYQLCLFGAYRYDHINYSTSNKIAFSRIFIKDWDKALEVAIYPPISGPMAVCKSSELNANVDYILGAYAQLNDTLGLFQYHKSHTSGLVEPLHMCLQFYEKLEPEEPPVKYQCFHINPNNASNFSLAQYLIDQKFNKEYKLWTELRINFMLLAFSYKPRGTGCNLFNVSILFDNHDMDGLMTISLQSDLMVHPCDSRTSSRTPRDETTHDIINTIVILVCSVSLFLCTRAVIRAQFLKYKTVDYFRRVRRIELSMEGRCEFWNFWYIMIIINDILIINGSFMEGKISRNDSSNTEWSVGSLCLGTGTMLVWFGVLRYFGFFKNYNIVILTLKRAFPEMTRFLMCTLIIYAGFVFCGWLVLGPFHIKFRSLSRTSENLFSLINGDDMFATFTILDSESQILWWFSRIYMYSFISLFIYVILNLFLSVILDAYETIKEYYESGFPKSDLQTFICENENEHFIDSNISDLDHDVSVFNQSPCCYLRTLFCWRSPEKRTDELGLIGKESI